MWSCSNDDNISSEPQVINQQDEPTVRTLDRFSEIEPSFASFLMQSETRSSKATANRADPTAVSPSKSVWSDKVFELKNDEGLTAQMVEGEYMGKATVACVYYAKTENTASDPKILLMQQVADNEYILCDQNDTPLLKVIQNDNDLEYTLLADQKEVLKYFCNTAMVVLGWEVATILAVPSGGSSLLFGVLWGTISYIKCK